MVKSKPKKKRDLLRVEDLSADELEQLLDLAMKIKKQPNKYATRLAGRSLAMIFEKASTRTRVSFEVAMVQTGGHALFLSPNDIQIGRGETIPDTARVLSRYADAIMFRTFAHSKAEELAKWSSVPVINGLTDDHHPCQIFADLLTLKERFGKLTDVNLVYVGDGNNVVHSLLTGCALTGVNFKVVCPEQYQPDPKLLAAAIRLGKKHGSKIEMAHETKDALKGADAVYTDAWVSMGQEAAHEKKVRDFQGFQVNGKLMKQAPKAIFLHCLPAHRGEEVADEIMDSKRSAVWDQAENRLHVQKALLIQLIERTL